VARAWWVDGMTAEPAADMPQVLATGLAYPESPRWRDGRLWFAH
jgi:hypothetical protein